MTVQIKDQIYRETFLESFKGLDTVSSITNMEIGYLRQADNCNITEVGAIEKRQGYVPVLDPLTLWTGRSVRFGINYKVNPTTNRQVVFGEDTVDGELGYVNGTAITVVAAALATNRPSIVQFDALLFFFNGVSCFLYDGTATRQIGITAPVAAPTDNGNIVGGLVIGASYLWAYTYYNSATGAESSPSPLSAAIVIGAGGGRQLNITPGNPLTADTIRIYRTSANGPILFLDGTAAIAAVTYNSIIPDLQLGQELELDNTRITTWGEPTYALVSQNRIFLTGIAANPNRVQISKIGAAGPMPESYMAQSFADCVSSGGINDVNLGLGQANDVVVVLKPYSIGRLDQLGSINNESGVDNVIFEYREISRATTAASHWAQCNVYNNIVWLGTDNIYMTDGTQIIPIADRIANIIKSINFLSLINLSAQNDRANKRVYFSVDITLPGDIIVQYQIVGSYRKFPEFGWTIYKHGRNLITHPGLPVASFYDSEESYYFGNSIYDGQIYQMNVGDNDNGSGIFFNAIDYPTKMGLDEEPKLFFKDIIHAQGDGGNYNLNVYSIYDLSNQESDPGALSLLAGGAIWDVSLWDVDTWGENVVKRLPYSTHKKATYKQLKYSQINADEPVTIFGYTKVARPQEFK